MKLKYKAIIVISLILLLVAIFLNWMYEFFALHPFWRDGEQDLKVMTWNVHCSAGADEVRQRKIAELIVKEGPDFVLLNEYNQNKCLVIDSLLMMSYPYVEEYQSHRFCGDIFYSKRMMSNSGHVFTPIGIKGIQTIKATIAVGIDSVLIYGVHMESNQYDDETGKEGSELSTSAYRRYKKKQANRVFQAHWTKEAILESKHPVIVMGDMNDFNCSAPLDTFATCGLKDSWWEGGFGYGATFHDGWLKLRIDHILHSKELKLESIKVIETNLSDHNPVVAGFSLNTNTNRTN